MPATAPPSSAGLRIAGEVDETELADLHLVAAGELHRLDPLAVEIGAVEAADVADGEAVGLAVELRVPARDGDVVEEDVALRVPARSGDVLVEKEPAAGVGTALDDQQGGAGGQRLDADVGELVASVVIGTLDAAHRDRGRLLCGSRAADGGIRQRRPAAGAELAVVRILLATLRAEHARHRAVPLSMSRSQREGERPYRQPEVQGNPQPRRRPGAGQPDRPHGARTGER